MSIQAHLVIEKKEQSDAVFRGMTPVFSKHLPEISFSLSKRFSIETKEAIIGQGLLPIRNELIFRVC